MSKNKSKKPFFKKWWFWLIVVLMIGSCGANSDTATDPVSTTPPTTQTPTSEPTTAANTSIELIAGEPGEYGELFTINEGTEFEETYYIYRIPAGTYTVTNAGKYMSQFNVYSGEVHVTDDGWEEFTEAVYVKLLDVGASDTFTIADGQCIEIQEPAMFTLELVG